MSVTSARLKSIVQPAVEAVGYEFVGVEFEPRRGRSLLRVYIDSAAGITVDDCQRASHQVSGALDVDDPIPGEYDLEVSSPGLDRPLFERAHYERFAGQRVRMKLGMPIGDRRNFTGRIDGVEGDAVRLVEDDGTEHLLPLADIGTARLVPDF